MLLVSLYLTLAATGQVPLWLTATVVLRDVVIVLGAAAYRYFIGYLEGRPTHASTLNTFMQLSFVLLVISRLRWPQVPALAVTLVGALVFVTTVVSGLEPQS